MALLLSRRAKTVGNKSIDHKIWFDSNHLPLFKERVSQHSINLAYLPFFLSEKSSKHLFQKLQTQQ